MTCQRVAALGLLVGVVVAAAAFRNDVLAATLAGAAAGFAHLVDHGAVLWCEDDVTEIAYTRTHL